MPPWEFREKPKESNGLPAPSPTPQTQPDRSTQHSVSVSASATSTPEKTARPSEFEPTPSASLNAAQLNKTIPPLPLKLSADTTGAREETAFEKRAKQRCITQLEEQATPAFLESLGPDWREMRLHELGRLVPNLPELERKLQEEQEERERRVFLIAQIKANASQEYLGNLGADWEENLPLRELSEHNQNLLAQKRSNEWAAHESNQLFPKHWQEAILATATPLELQRIFESSLKAVVSQTLSPVVGDGNVLEVSAWEQYGFPSKYLVIFSYMQKEQDETASLDLA